MSVAAEHGRGSRDQSGRSHETQHPYRPLVALALAPAVGAAAPAHADELSPDDLLARYQPVLVLDRFERFAPATVEGFLADSDLQELGDDNVYHTVAMQPPGLPAGLTAPGPRARSCTRCGPTRLARSPGTRSAENEG
jgi:hypothetical protein